MDDAKGVEVSELSGEVLAASNGGREANDSEGDTQVSQDAIARRAYEISQSDDAGTNEENWQQAERELRNAAR